MKTVKLLNPMGGTEAKIIRVSDNKAEELINSPFYCAKYVAKHIWKIICNRKECIVDVKAVK